MCDTFWKADTFWIAEEYPQLWVSLVAQCREVFYRSEPDIYNLYHFTLYQVESLPAKQNVQVWSLGQEDPLEKEMATHSNILARENPMGRGPWSATVPRIVKESDTT